MNRFVIGIFVCFIASVFAGQVNAAPADVDKSGCLEVVGIIEANEIRACITLVASLMAQEASSSARANLLSVRAELHARLARKVGQGGTPSAAETEAALNDYDAALTLLPEDVRIREDKAQYLLDLGRYEPALAEVENLLRMKPERIGYVGMKAQSLLGLRRFHDVIDTANSALPLAGQCAEAFKIQIAADRLKSPDEAASRQNVLNAVPPGEGFVIYASNSAPDSLDPNVLAMGFNCAQPSGDGLRDAVTGKPSLLLLRGKARQEAGDAMGAMNDFLEAQMVGDPIFNEASYEICALATDTGQEMTAATFCRRWMEGYSVPVIPPFGWPGADPKVAARIARYLLEDGDVRDACRILRTSELQPESFRTDPALKALRKRIASGKARLRIQTCN